MRFRRTFPSRPDSVPAARRFVLGTLTAVPDSVLDAVGVMVSELATNALLYAGTVFEVTVEQHDGILRVGLTDFGGGEPQIQQRPPTVPHGRGLRIVNELSNDWGVVPSSEDEGKTVWFTLILRSNGELAEAPNGGTDR
jgi:anti-sigma regulatory factor (Ser/Thr protein kinase)